MEEPQSEIPAKIIISVPKRIFKRAVDRNKLKRRIREAYRKNKTALYEELNSKKVLLMVIYTSKKMEEYNEIEKRMLVAFQKINNAINPKN